MNFVLTVLASILGTYISIGIPVTIGFVIGYVKVRNKKKAVQKAFENLKKGNVK